MKKTAGVLIKYMKEKSGLVTIEWVAISAVVILAALMITSGIMHSASGLGTAVISNIDTATTNVVP